MKIPNIRKIQQIAYNHSSDSDFEDFMNFIKSAQQNPLLFLLLILLFHQIIIYVLENSINALYEGRELTFNAFRNGIFPIRETKR